MILNEKNRQYAICFCATTYTGKLYVDLNQMACRFKLHEKNFP